MPIGIKTGGRKAGTPNKRTLFHIAMVERIEKQLRAEHKLTLENLSVALLTCGEPSVVQKELTALREYKYGKPKEHIQHDVDVNISVLERQSAAQSLKKLVAYDSEAENAIEGEIVGRTP